MKKDQNLPNKIFQIFPFQIILAEDHQINEIHKTVPKIDIVDQISQNNQYRCSYARSNSDRIEVTIQTPTETAHIQILQKYVKVLTAYQIFHVNEIKTIQPIDQEITQL